MVAAPADVATRRSSAAAPTSRSSRSRSTTRGCATPARSSWSPPTASRHALHFRFNAWGEKWAPWDADAAVGARDRRAPRAARCTRCRWCSRADRSRSTARGLLVTTERCLLNPNRNPDADAAPRSRRRCASTSASIASSGSPTRSPRTTAPTATSTTSSRSRAPGAALLQGCDDPRIRTTRSRADNRRRLRSGRHRRGRGPGAPVRATSRASRLLPVPYVNLYALQRRGARADERRTPPTPTMLAIIAERVSRTATSSPVPGAVLAHGGGGVHCITQQVPA